MNKAILEGILFIAGSDGVDVNKISEIMNIETKQALELLEEIKKEYEDDNHGIMLSILGNNYKFVTKIQYNEYFKKLKLEELSKTLSDSALETLAIIAYNEPVTRSKISEIRGVDSSYVVRKLELRNLITQCGRSEEIGHPVLYKTTNQFLDYFGLEDITKLPVINSEYSDDLEQDLFESKYTDVI